MHTNIIKTLLLLGFIFPKCIIQNLKGQSILKCLFGVFNSSKKTNENNST